MSKVLMVASEAVPFAKSGGLADVVGSLPAELVAIGDDVAVLLPRYGGIPLDRANRVAADLEIWFGADCYPYEIHAVVERGVPFFLIDCPALFDRDGYYTSGGKDYPDNHVRFAVLCRAALDIVRYLYRPEVIHCHDWQASLVAPYLKHEFANDPTYLGLKLVLTIHNLGYQGRFGRETMSEVGLDERLFTSGIVECDGEVNFLKAGIQLADAITTVSPGYAREIQTPEFGCGLDTLLRERRDVLTGILNGANYDEWNPATDPHIAAHYSARNIRGKKVCKKDLLQNFGLPAGDLNRPVLGIVSRFAAQKGFDLIEAVAGDLVRQDANLVVLGSGDPHYEELFRRLATEHPGRIAVRVAYDNTLAHKIEAGADIFLMPSRYEPCGLNQIYSLRYGTVPVVRATGGLDDTIDAATGFKFQEYSAEALTRAVREALDTYTRPRKWRRMIRAGMGKDYSWRASARRYSALYRSLARCSPAG